jgi:hypothetical protein
VTDGRRRLGGFLTETEGREKDIRGKEKKKLSLLIHLARFF